MVHIKDMEEISRGRMKSLYSFTVQSSPSVHGRGEALNKYLLNESGMVGKNTYRKVNLEQDMPEEEIEHSLNSSGERQFCRQMY